MPIKCHGYAKLAKLHIQQNYTNICHIWSPDNHNHHTYTLQTTIHCTVVLFTEWTLTTQMVNQTVRESYGTKSLYHF